MKAILINVQTKTIEHIEVGNDYKEIYGIIGNGCTTFTCPITLDNNDTMYCDDEGLFHDQIGAIIYPEWSYPLVGNVLVMGTCAETGETVDVRSSIEEIKEGLKFIDAEDENLTNWFNRFN